MRDLEHVGAVCGLLLAMALTVSCGGRSPAKSSPVAANQGHTTTLTVRVLGLKSAEGIVAFALFDDESAFNDQGEPLRAQTVPLTSDTCSWQVEAPVGEYALKVYHDRNGNGQLDRNKLGVPTEPYGFSNDARGSFGPPKYKAARFTLEPSMALEVTVR